MVPSSQVFADLKEALAAIFHDAATELLTLRLEQLASELLGLNPARANRRSGRADSDASQWDAVIVDTSPTVLGTSRLAYELHHSLVAPPGVGLRRIALNVMTPDLPSVAGCMRAFGDLQEELACPKSTGPSTMHVMNMILPVDELGFGDRANTIGYYRKILTERHVRLIPDDGDWVFVRWSKGIAMRGVNPSIRPGTTLLMSDEHVEREIGEIARRVLGEDSSDA